MENQLRILTGNTNNEWNEIVKSFKTWDVYYLYEYSRALELHGDGKPVLFYFESEGFKASYVSIISDISLSPLFHGALKKEDAYDMETPYGYGGSLMQGVCLIS